MNLILYILIFNFFRCYVKWWTMKNTLPKSDRERSAFFASFGSVRSWSSLYFLFSQLCDSRNIRGYDRMAEKNRNNNHNKRYERICDNPSIRVSGFEAMLGYSSFRLALQIANVHVYLHTCFHSILYKYIFSFFFHYFCEWHRFVIF